eukprot:TRINITY_DN41593_c0_g2_i2.p1 TRINITY_DN41593_c0_g2~~TRINITY_DN41593_c0_g2_i2.p1  ORF type:complete len:317 (-),score=22.87 TRINITY_DN41593_c0_g2_i2:288-1148(-)
MGPHACRPFPPCAFFPAAPPPLPSFSGQHVFTPLACGGQCEDEGCMCIGAVGGPYDSQQVRMGSIASGAVFPPWPHLAHSPAAAAASGADFSWGWSPVAAQHPHAPPRVLFGANHGPLTATVPMWMPPPPDRNLLMTPFSPSLPWEDDFPATRALGGLGASAAAGASAVGLFPSSSSASGGLSSAARQMNGVDVSGIAVAGCVGANAASSEECNCSDDEKECKRSRMRRQEIMAQLREEACNFESENLQVLQRAEEAERHLVELQALNAKLKQECTEARMMLSLAK